jgi:predicted dehydrogenase
MVNTRYGDKQCAMYSDDRELLARPEIDAVLIATGERWHPLVCIEAAHNGKHMYCEKPPALSVAEAQAVRAAVRRAGVTFQCGAQQRPSFYYRHAVELVRNGSGLFRNLAPGRSVAYQKIITHPRPTGTPEDVY